LKIYKYYLVFPHIDTVIPYQRIYNPFLFFLANYLILSIRHFEDIVHRRTSRAFYFCKKRRKKVFFMAGDNQPSNELKHGAIGTLALVFLVVAAAAPLGASATNTPLIFFLGNGAAAPLDFVLIGVLLILFAVGFTTMSSHVTNAGAFYTYISMGLGKRFGTAAGYVAVAAYNILTVYLVCANSTFASQIIETELGIAIPWWIVGLVLAAAIYLLSYFGIEGGTKFLMVCLVCEVCVLAVVDLSVLFQDGLGSYTLDCFSPEVFVSGAPGLGVCFAFLCFIGFEATAIFGEEAKNPRRTVPRATYIAVIFIGVVYSLSAWSVVAAVGAENVVELAAEDPAGLYYSVAVSHCGAAIGHIFYWLLVISNFASWMAAHNMASRYLYAFSRAGLLPAALQRTHSKFKSPHIASAWQMAFALVVSYAVVFIFGMDPYEQVGSLASAIAIVGIMALELLVSVAVIRYLRANNDKPGFGHNVFATTIAPILSLVGMAVILVLVLSNFSLLTGSESLLVNILLAGLMIIVGLIGYFVAVALDKKGKLEDPVSIEVE
jgi:amino acid transporter